MAIPDTQDIQKRRRFIKTALALGGAGYLAPKIVGSPVSVSAQGMAVSGGICGGNSTAAVCSGEPEFVCGADCFCAPSAGGGTVCFQATCTGATICTTNADCPAGRRCFTLGCCGLGPGGTANVCLPLCPGGVVLSQGSHPVRGSVWSGTP